MDEVYLIPCYQCLLILEPFNELVLQFQSQLLYLWTGMSFILQLGTETEGTQTPSGIYEREEGIQIDYSTLEMGLKVISAWNR